MHGVNAWPNRRDWVAALCEALADNAALLAAGDDGRFQNKIHLAMDAKGFVEPKQDSSAG